MVETSIHCQDKAWFSIQSSLLLNIISMKQLRIYLLEFSQLQKTMMFYICWYFFYGPEYATSVNVPCVLENSVSCCFWVQYSITVNWIKLFDRFSSSVPLLIFCVLVLLITEKGVLKSPSIILALSISLVSSMVFASRNVKVFSFRCMLTQHFQIFLVN